MDIFIDCFGQTFSIWIDGNDIWSKWCLEVNIVYSRARLGR